MRSMRSKVLAMLASSTVSAALGPDAKSRLNCERSARQDTALLCASVSQTTSQTIQGSSFFAGPASNRRFLPPLSTPWPLAAQAELQGVERSSC